MEERREPRPSAARALRAAEAHRTDRAVLAKYGIELKRQGNNMKGCCPIHKGSNPRQFVVDEAKGLWRCFSPSCDRGGGMLELVAELEKVDVKQAALLVADWFCIKPGSDVQTSQTKGESDEWWKTDTQSLPRGKARERQRVLAPRR